METSTNVSRRWTPSRPENGGLPSARLPTSTEPTTHQKVRRIIEEHAWKSRNNERKSSNCSLRDYTIVASRGELSRGTFTVRETSLDRRGKSPISDNSLVSGKDEIGRIGREKKTNNWERRRDNDKSIAKLKNIRISKSPSLPVNLKEGLGPPVKLPNEGILKRSSAFIEKFTGGDKKELKRSNEVKRPSQLTPSAPGLGGSLRKSPSYRTLNARGRSRTDVKKSVSFSKDTAFEGKKEGSFSKPIVHEVKVYRKGVLRDFNDIESLRKPEESQEQGMSLLRAAREADELALNDLVNRIRRTGLGKIDVNATDSSGRSVISYMAGNGAAELLETMLSFPGANPNLPDNEGNTPLHFAAQAGQAECLNILIQRSTGIELDARNVLGFTPLMKAAIQGRTRCAKILLFAGSNPALKDHGRGLRADQWARFCGRHVCADVIERFARHKIIDRKSTSYRWGSEPELAAKVLQGKVIPVQAPIPVTSNGIKSRIKRVFRVTSGQDKSFSLVSQLTSAALCASTPALPKPGEIAAVRNLLRPLSVPQLRVTLAPDFNDKNDTNFSEKIENTIVKPARSKKKSK